jgi:hypothetical protein
MGRRYNRRPYCLHVIVLLSLLLRCGGDCSSDLRHEGKKKDAIVERKDLG